MDIGILREIKPDEGRVALTPRDAAALAARGHRVWVETDAGLRAGYPDDLYRAAGARPVEKAAVLDGATLLLKVKAPLPAEYADYRREHVLLAFLHLDENIAADEIGRLIAGGFVGLASEAIVVDGRRPVLESMSRLTGYLFAQRALELCTARKGVFGPRLEAWLPGARAVLVGPGQIGLSVLRHLLALGVRTTLMANASEDAVNRRANARFGTPGRDRCRELEAFVRMDPDRPERAQAALAEAMRGADIVINAAVRRASLPHERLPHLVTRAMLAGLAPGSVICDATACDRDLVETCVSSPHLDHVDVIDGVVHYSPDHIPALVARTASDLFSAASLPVVLALADAEEAGLPDAPVLLDAVACADGHLTQTDAARAKGLDHRPAAAVLRDRAARRSAKKPGG